MGHSNPKSPSWLALSAAAAALPACAPTAQAAVTWEADAGYRASYYREADLPASATNGLDGQRMEVLTQQFHHQGPINGELDYAIDATLDTISGASPWFIVPDAEGRPIQILSGATIDDQRYALQGRLRQHTASGRRAVQAGVSKENDYLAISGAVEGEWDFDRESRTLSGGLGYSYDQLRPTEGGSARFPDRARRGDKDTLNVYGAFTQAFSKLTLAQVGASFSRGHGFLSDPYKRVFVAGDIIPERRPGERLAVAVTARLRHFLPSMNAALHLDLRSYFDDWGIGSDTVEARWVQTLPGGWRLSPSLRWHQQGKADFYRPFFTTARADHYHSADPRLSAFGAIGARLSVQKEWGDWQASLSAEGYRADADYAIRHVDSASPGLVEFGVVSLAFTYRWFAAPKAATHSFELPPEPVRVIEVTP